MHELLLATGNAGKLREMLDALGDVPFRVVSLMDMNGLVQAEVEETGRTFEENAILKAKTYGDRFHTLTLAEDSGLEVDALGGRPGVRTARYARGTDENRYRKLLGEMKDVPEGKRAARFVTVVAIFDPANKKLQTCEGEYRGHITLEPRGSGGFGYDPVFYSDELRKTGAEMSVEEKNTVSHRGRAMAKARDILLAQYQTLA